MTEKQVLRWIKLHLSQYIVQAIAEAKEKNPTLIYTEDWLSGITYRETGFLIARYVMQAVNPNVIHTLMRGDYNQRKGENEKSYHGFGYTQIDIGSFPEFVKSGKWKDPLECYRMSISVLEGKRKYLFASGRFKEKDFTQEMVHRAITAAYNCGEGNVSKVLREGRDVDLRTHQHNYSKEVWRFRGIYRELL
jgi:hypothetical protein